MGGRSEIDDIFAGNAAAASKGVAAKAAASSVKEAGSSSSSSKAKKKKQKSSDDKGKGSEDAVKSGKKRVAETVLDPSLGKGSSSSSASGKKQKKAALTEEEKEFRDTRGAQRKKTDDGLAVYTEAELGLNDKGGDTPLCPFDCDCCF